MQTELDIQENLLLAQSRLQDLTNGHGGSNELQVIINQLESIMLELKREEL